MPSAIDPNRIPNHIAIIMDGNGRWAKSRYLPRSKGHIEGVKRVEEIVDYASDIGIKVITLYTFSTENWNRPASEVSILMNIIGAVLKRKLRKLQKSNMKFQSIGRPNRIPGHVQKAIDIVINETKDNTGLIVNLAFNYGGRSEIVDAVKGVVTAVSDNKITIDDIDEKLFGSFLYTKNLPDPELLIRTSGEKRISNFLLWQLSYSEFYFTDKYWPDFNLEEFSKAILDFQNRQRRFGDIVTAK